MATQRDMMTHALHVLNETDQLLSALRDGHVAETWQLEMHQNSVKQVMQSLSDQLEVVESTPISAVQKLANQVQLLLSKGTVFTSVIEFDAYDMDFDAAVWKSDTKQLLEDLQQTSRNVE